MLITTSSPERTVTDYYFALVTGATTTITIDHEAGDQMEKDDQFYRATLTAKPSLTDPNVIMAAEETEITRQHIMFVQKWDRVVQPKTPEQQFQWDQLMKELSGKQQIM